MQYFEQDFISFFQDLSGNNHKEWFHANKLRYENSVKKPFEFFIGDLIKHMQKFEPALNINPKDCILRINKDIRFSKDKSPYNLHYSAFVSQGGRKDKSIPGLFLRFSPESIGIMGGCYSPSKEQLSSIRNTISDDIKAFNQIVKEKLFVEKFGQIKGETIKRIPPDLKDAAVKEPLILNKQFYFVAEREAGLIISETLIDELMNYWKIAKPVNDYFLTCIKT